MALGEGFRRFFRSSNDVDRDIREEAYVEVVGTGPCGAVVANELARAVKREVLLEEGPPFTPPEFEFDASV